MEPSKSIRLMLAIVAALGCQMPAARAKATAASATTQVVTPAKSYEFDVDATMQWMDTGIDLRTEEKLHFAASGTITYPGADTSKSAGKSEAKSFGPDGLARGWTDLVHQYAVPNAGHGALIGRLGSGDGAQPFLVGGSSDYQAPVAGRLFFGINQSQKDAGIAAGSFHIKIEVTDPGLSTAEAAVAGGPPETRIFGLTPALLDEIPRRASDPDHNPGDMVNILIVGSEDDVVLAFKAAGWVHMDSSVETTAISGLVDSLQKKDYLTMPMSTLCLFNRPQDYGFAHAEPVRVAMSRNHLRAWKSPYEVAGRPVWCVAATHDIGFERDERNNGVTHKIDPAIDGEREYVNDTLSSTGLVVARDHVTPASPLTEAKTATGGSFHSDGRILVLALKSSAATGAN
jgi:hypothetical protein